MSVTIRVTYDGDLHCTAVHGPSGDRITTDAPVDNEGKGQHFAPTDLVATASATCVLTILGIVARKRGLELEGARAEIVKEMGSVPRRHIARLDLRVVLPASLPVEVRPVFEAAARACPVHASLGPLTTQEMTFVYE